MNQLDDELVLLRNRIAALEEKKRREEENKMNPMTKLEAVIDEKKKNHRYPGPGSHRDRFVNYNMLTGELAYLEPILYALQDIQKRLTALEEPKLTSP
jgi:hypothetical protein